MARSEPDRLLVEIFLALMLFIFMDAKSRAEETLREQVYPKYASYKNKYPGNSFLGNFN